LRAVTREMNEALGSYRFHEAAYTIYHFFWHEFCDWYLEWVKPEITQAADEDEDKGAPTAWINLTRVFQATLHLLHPFMPFITEELWHQLPRLPGREPSISLASFNLVSDRVADPVSEKQFQAIVELIVAARNAKAEMGLQKHKPAAQVASEDLRVLELFREHQGAVCRMAGLAALNFTRGRLVQQGGTGVRRVNAAADLRIFHEQQVDVEAERARLEREKSRIEQQMVQLKGQLDNDGFRCRAPQEVVRAAELRLAELEGHYQKVVESLERLGPRGG